MWPALERQFYDLYLQYFHKAEAHRRCLRSSRPRLRRLLPTLGCVVPSALSRTARLRLNSGSASA